MTNFLHKLQCRVPFSTLQPAESLTGSQAHRNFLSIVSIFFTAIAIVQPTGDWGAKESKPSVTKAGKRKKELR